MSYPQIEIPEVYTYKRDGRIPLTKLYKLFLRLKKSRWVLDIVSKQKIELGKKEISLPILAFRTRQKGDALWIISGIHGEEPAGINAIAKNIKFLNRLAKKIPIVLIPLCNPAGYRRDWRYPNSKRKPRNGIISSVGDSEHYLLNERTEKARARKVSNKEAEKITAYVIKHSKKYNPLVVLDLHEDESAKKLYIYSQGKLRNYDPIARKIVSILKDNGFRFYDKGKTAFGEKIIKGVVSNIKDGSIDELLSSEKIIVNGKIKKGPDAKSVVVIETKTLDVPLKIRVKAHSHILKSSKSIYALAKDIFSED